MYISYNIIQKSDNINTVYSKKRMKKKYKDKGIKRIMTIAMYKNIAIKSLMTIKKGKYKSFKLKQEVFDNTYNVQNTLLRAK